MKSEDKALDTELTVKRRRIMIYFIEATEKLIRQDGLEGLTIRKIAAEAGYNSATIYNYFNDLEQLILFGSVCYLREYVTQLGQKLRKDMRGIDRFRTIYRCFNDCAFRSPDIYHNLFFGKYSDKLDAVLELYYHQLFPGELEQFSKPIEQMMTSGTMQERDRITMRQMVKEGDIRPERAEATLELVIALHQNFIYEASLKKGQLDIEEHQRKFFQLFEYLLAAGK